MLSDQQFIKEFEQLSLNPAHFNHLGHLRITWLYLNQHPIEQATEKVVSGIRQYATSLGAPDKFHMTMTRALVTIIANRCQPIANHSWNEFIEANQDLVNDAKALVGAYYSDAALESEIARREFVQPDRKSFSNG
ncbi:MAG: hypothetical protein ABJI60_15270 [Kangiellaceae bacterium]|jgi:hypothetical protein